MTVVYSKDMVYFSTFKPGPYPYGQESQISDYLTIEKDPVSSLPDKFTICSSLFLNLMTTVKNIIQIFKEDGTHWFNLSIDVDESSRNADKKERLTLYYQSTGKYYCNALVGPLKV